MTSSEICKLLLSQDTPSWFHDPKLEENPLPPQMVGAIILAKFWHQRASSFYLGGRKKNKKRGHPIPRLKFSFFHNSWWWYKFSIASSPHSTVDFFGLVGFGHFWQGGGWRSLLFFVPSLFSSGTYRCSLYISCLLWDSLLCYSPS